MAAARCAYRGAFCGAFALKGTLGRIPTWPWSATEMLSHAGPITRTVRDSALLFDILSGPDPLDHQALPAPGESFLDRCDQPLKPLRIGYCPTLFDTPVDPEIAAAVEPPWPRLARHLDWADPLATFETLWIAGRGIAYGKGLAQQMDQLDPGFAELIRRSAQYDLSDYLHAMQQRAAFANQVHALFEDYDLLLMPTLPILPFAADEVAPAGYIGQYSALPWRAGRRLPTLSIFPATRRPACRADAVRVVCPSVCKWSGLVLPTLMCCSSVPPWKTWRPGTSTCRRC